MKMSISKAGPTNEILNDFCDHTQIELRRKVPA